MSLVKTPRIGSIDLLRGIIMVIMALDHTRDYFHIGAFTDDPLNLATTTPWLYGTRWVTHFCAPIFVFLAGISAWLQSSRKTKKELSAFLISRGLWLVLVDLFIITLGTTSNIYFEYFIIQTLWAIGISMAILGLVIWLPFPVILSVGLLIVLGHNAVDQYEADNAASLPTWWHLLHKPGEAGLWGQHKLFIFYPFLPWTGLMLLGYCCGRIFTTNSEEHRNKILRWMGFGLLIFFALLRLPNLYGNFIPWTPQKTALFSFMSFMDVNKYPPSLLYMCATIGPALIFLGFVQHTKGRVASIFNVYGRVPMFFYIFHFYLLSAISLSLFFYHGHTVEEGLKEIPGVPFKFIIPGVGYSLPIVYLIWMAVVVFLYPFCKWYDTYKTHHPEKKWLSYL